MTSFGPRRMQHPGIAASPCPSCCRFSRMYGGLANALVNRGALRRRSSDCSCEASHVRSAHLLTVHATGRSRDRFVHECAAEVVRTRLQAESRAFHTHFDPRGLNVFDVRMQDEARNGVHPYRFAE